MNIKYLLISFIGLLTISACQERKINGAIIKPGYINIRTFSSPKIDKMMENLRNKKLEELKTFIKSKETIRLLTFRLLIHDGKTISGAVNEAPFQKIKTKKDYNLTNLIDYMESQLTNPVENGVDNLLENEITELATTLEYDYKSLLENLEVERIDESEMLNVAFLFDNPLLSRFATDALCEESISYSKSIQTLSFQKNVAFYKEKISEREVTMKAKQDSLQTYLKKNNLEDPYLKRRALVDKITRLELAGEESRKISASERIKLHEEELARLRSLGRFDSTDNPDSYIARLGAEIKLLQKDYLNIKQSLDTNRLQKRGIPIELIRSATLAKQ